jgi:hypothetical protein
MFGSRVQYDLPCSREGCEGVVHLSGDEFRLLQAAGILAQTPHDLLAIRRVQNQALIDNETAEDPVARTMAGRLALAASKENLRNAGVALPEQSGPSVQINQTFVEAGDSLDRELETMYREEGGVIDAQVVRDTPPAQSPPPDSSPPGHDDDAEGFA